MKDTARDPASAAIPAKRPLSPHLFSGATGTVGDVRVQSGYPVRSLIADWMARDYNDGAVIGDYALDPDEWEAAKRYYADHKPIIEARIILNQQPEDDDDVPAMRTAEDFFAWVTCRGEAGDRETSTKSRCQARTI